MDNLFLIKNKIANLSIRKKILTLLVGGSLFVPFISDAFIGGNIFSLFETQLAGLSEAVGPWTTFLIVLIIFLIVSGLALSASVSFLEIASNPANINILESEAVQIGWQFTSSLANIGIVLGLVVIGIATILGQDKYGAKKTLPKLVIAALLINFSLVFVGAIVDIAQIILNTFHRTDIFGEMTAHLWSSWDLVYSELTIYFTSLLAAYVIPFTAPVRQMTFAIAMTGVFLPNIAEAVFNSIISLFMAGVFFFYGILFLARRYILQILAVFSPLAFLAWAMPATKKYWKKWVGALVQWSFLGVILFFLLSLATTIVSPLQPEATNPSAGAITRGWLNMPSILMYYLMLGLYLLVAGKVAMSWAPKGADAIINGVQSAATGFRDISQDVAQPKWEEWKTRNAEEATDEGVQKQRERLDQAQGLSNVTEGLKYAKDQTMNTFARTQGKSPEKRAQETRSTLDYIDSEVPEETLIENIKEGGIREAIDSAQQGIERGSPEVLQAAIENSDRLRDDVVDDAKDKLDDVATNDLDTYKAIKNIKEVGKKLEGLKPSEFRDINFKNISNEEVQQRIVEEIDNRSNIKQDIEKNASQATIDTLKQWDDEGKLDDLGKGSGGGGGTSGGGGGTPTGSSGSGNVHGGGDITTGGIKDVQKERQKQREQNNEPKTSPDITDQNDINK